MQSNGAERGHVLLIGGDRAVYRRSVQVHPSANLAALSVVPVPVLLNSTLPADLVHLDGVNDQNTLLLRLRTAAATQGPLLVYLSGRLTLDRKGHRFHLASTGTNASNTRYTALPWEWLHNELRGRPAGWTTLLLDLAADKGAWAELQELGSLPAVNADTYGTVSPPGFPGTSGASPYTRQMVEQLRRNPDRPSAQRLHALTVAAAQIPPGALVLPTAPAIETYDDEEWPSHRPPVTNLQRLLAGDTSLLPPRRPRPQPQEFAPGLETAQPAPASVSPPAAPFSYPSPSPVQAPAPTPVEHPAPAPVRQQPYVPPQQPPAQSHGRPSPSSHQQREERPQEPVRAPHPGTGPTVHRQPHGAPPQQAPAPAPAPTPVSVPVQQSAPTPQQQDPRLYIWQTAQAGKHNEAAEMAAAWEQHALQQYGPDSAQATQWAEIRADLARIAGRWMFATQLWIAATHTRMAHQAPDAAEVLNGAKSAHYCWTEIKDAAEARDCGPELVNLLRQLPTLDRRHLTSAQQRMEYLQNAPTLR